MEAITVIPAVINGIELAKKITDIVRKLKSTPFIIRIIHDKVDQITHRLRHLRRESQTRILPLDLTEAWLGYQQTCNKTLSRIQEILFSYTKRSRSKLAVLDSAKFQYFGGKDELDELLGSINECYDYFCWLSETILKTPMVDDILLGGTQASTDAVPILSLGQHIQMMLRDDVVEKA